MAGSPTSEPTAVDGPADPRFVGMGEVDTVAEVHFVLRPQLVSALGRMVLSEDARHRYAPIAETYRQFWEHRYGDRYFDMSTLQRLASAVETGLRHHHALLAGPDRAREVTRSRSGIFQGLIHPGELLRLYRNDCGYDLVGNPSWARAREMMVHRHLYAHRSGLVDDRYLTDLQLVTGEDLRPDMADRGYPDEEVIWFRPLNQLTLFIEDMRRFFRYLPTSSPGLVDEPSP